MLYYANADAEKLVFSFLSFLSFRNRNAEPGSVEGYWIVRLRRMRMSIAMAIPIPMVVAVARRGKERSGGSLGQDRDLAVLVQQGEAFQGIGEPRWRWRWR